MYLSYGLFHFRSPILFGGHKASHGATASRNQNLFSPHNLIK